MSGLPPVAGGAATCSACGLVAPDHEGRCRRCNRELPGDGDVETSAPAYQPGQLSVAGTVGLILDALRRCTEPEKLPLSLDLGVCHAVVDALVDLGGATSSTVYSEPGDAYVIDSVELRVGSTRVCALRPRRAPHPGEEAALSSDEAHNHTSSYRAARCDK